jgi:hypothetical protein
MYLARVVNELRSHWAVAGTPKTLNMDVSRLLWESQSGQYEWHSLIVDNVNKMPPLSESAKVRLFLLEGLPAKSSEDRWSSLLQLPSRFFERHEKEIVPNVGSKLEGRDNIFFAKWLRYERQDDRHWYIENSVELASLASIHSFHSRFNH